MRCPHHHWHSVLHPHRHPCLRPPQPLHLSPCSSLSEVPIGRASPVCAVPPYNLRLRQNHLINLFLVAYILPGLQWRRFCFWRRSWQWRCIWGVWKNIIIIADSPRHSFPGGFLLQLPLFLLPLPPRCPLLYLRPSHKLPPTKFLLKRLPLPLQLLLQNIHHSQKIASATDTPDLCSRAFPHFAAATKLH